MTHHDIRSEPVRSVRPDVTASDTGEFKLQVLQRMARIEKLLETINLRLAGSPRPVIPKGPDDEV